MGCGPSKHASHHEKVDPIERILQIKKSHPENRMAKHFDVEYFKSLAPAEQEALLQCCRSGIENPDSSMGCYAMQPADYDRFKPFFEKVIRDYHKIEDTEAVHVNNWSLADVSGLPEGGLLDLSQFGLADVSMRVRVGRNLEKYPLPGAMSRDDRINMEKEISDKVFTVLKEKWGGRYNSLTPGHVDHITDEEYKTLVDKRQMFKDMSADEFLITAGIAADWPYGRGCYVSADESLIVWLGEEDHLRIMSMKKGVMVNDVFDALKELLDTFESVGLNVAKSATYGFVTSCPTNLGTGMRASVLLKLPALTNEGKSDAEAKAVCKEFELSVRGGGGEHTPIGADGLVDISPSRRLMITEATVVSSLYFGVEKLLAKEKEHAEKPKASKTDKSEAPEKSSVSKAEKSSVSKAEKSSVSKAEKSVTNADN